MDAKYDPDEVGEDGHRIDGTLAGYVGGNLSYRDWLRILEGSDPADIDRHRRTAKTYAEKSAAQTLMAAEALTEDAFADPEAYVKTRALIDRQINGPPGSDMVPVRALREWTAAFFATIRERHGDEEATAILKAIRRRMTSTQAENLPRLGTK